MLELAQFTLFVVYNTSKWVQPAMDTLYLGCMHKWTN